MSVLSLIYLVTAWLRIAKWNPTETTEIWKTGPKSSGSRGTNHYGNTAFPQYRTPSHLTSSVVCGPHCPWGDTEQREIQSRGKDGLREPARRHDGAGARGEGWAKADVDEHERRAEGGVQGSGGEARGRWQEKCGV